MRRVFLVIAAIALLFIGLIVIPYNLFPVIESGIRAHDSSPERVATRNAERGLNPPWLATAQETEYARQTSVVLYGTPTRPPTRTPRPME
jgi:hypothetical protein